jgi:hypothetical protein
MVLICELELVLSLELLGITYWLHHFIRVGFVECSVLLHVVIDHCEMED